MKPAFANLHQLSACLASGEFSACELTQYFLRRIDLANTGLHAYVHVDTEGAMQLARAADARRAAGCVLGVFDGVPIAIKDLCDIEERVTTAGSEAWRGRIRHETATVVRRLLQAGMVVLGKLHMSEFAAGSWGLSPMGTPVNPWGLPQKRIPGGSSSGSGVAVAAGLAAAALGSDTGGSVRIPAAFNGVSGIKTSTGLISRHGVVPLSQTLDSIGFLAHTIEDACSLSLLTAGYDAKDPATWRIPVIQSLTRTQSTKPLTGIHLAFMEPEQFPSSPTPEICQALKEARRVLEMLGASCAEYKLPFNFKEIAQIANNIITTEAYAYHKDYINDLSLPIGSETRARILQGRDTSAADYIKLLEQHTAAQAHWQAWIEQHADALVLPTLPVTACLHEEVNESLSTLAFFTRAANFMNAVALSIPVGFSSEGLPIGMQLLGKPWSEVKLSNIGIAFQQNTDWHLRQPNLSSLGTL